MPDRPARVTHAPVITHASRPVKEMLGELPAKAVASFDNAKLKPCCRKVMDHHVEISKTHPDAPGPDQAVFDCACGRKHIRLAVGGGRVGAA